MRIIGYHITNRIGILLIGTLLLITATMLLKLHGYNNWLVDTVALVGLFLIGVAIIWEKKK